MSSVCVSANAQGFLAVVDTPLEHCKTFVVVTAETFLESNLTALEMGQFMGVGISLMLFSYFLTYPIGIVKQVIRKV